MSQAPAKIHIWEFPKDFRIQLDRKETRPLVDRAKEGVGGIKSLASLLKVHVTTLYEYRAGDSSIPLKILLKLCELTGGEFPVEQLEQDIRGYKSGMRTQLVKNPILPIQETPELFAVIGHLTGDGGHSRLAYYHNTCRTLIDEFMDHLRIVFGEVPIRIAVDAYERRIKARKEVIGVYFPMTIVRLLRHLYHVDFRTFTSRVPPRLFDLPWPYAAAYLRAFGDDEGRVHDSHIELYSANKELMRDISDLVGEKFPELSEFMSLQEKKGPQDRINVYTLRFTTGAFASYQDLIGFTHPEKKHELGQILARKKRGWQSRTPGQTRRMLLRSLKSGAMTTKELARVLNVSVQAIRYHLGELTTLGAVIQTGRRGNAKMLAITGLGRKLLELPPIGLEMLEPNYRVRTKLKILKTLAAGEGVILRDLVHQLGLVNSTISRYLNTYTRKGQNSETSGLIDLGLVRRSRKDGKAPYTYHLTNEGQKVVKIIATLFPDL